MIIHNMKQNAKVKANQLKKASDKLREIKENKVVPSEGKKLRNG